MIVVGVRNTDMSRRPADRDLLVDADRGRRHLERRREVHVHVDRGRDRVDRDMIRSSVRQRVGGRLRRIDERLKHADDRAAVSAPDRCEDVVNLAGPYWMIAEPKLAVAVVAQVLDRRKSDSSTSTASCR